MQFVVYIYISNERLVNTQQNPISFIFKKDHLKLFILQISNIYHEIKFKVNQFKLMTFFCVWIFIFSIKINIR